MKCKDCKYFDPGCHVAEELGYCRRYAPRPRSLTSAEVDAADEIATAHVWAEYPIKAEDDWCGEFSAKPLASYDLA